MTRIDQRALAAWYTDKVAVAARQQTREGRVLVVENRIWEATEEEIRAGIRARAYKSNVDLRVEL